VHDALMNCIAPSRNPALHPAVQSPRPGSPAKRRTRVPPGTASYGVGYRPLYRVVPRLVRRFTGLRARRNAVSVRPSARRSPTVTSSARFLILRDFANSIEFSGFRTSSPKFTGFLPDAGCFRSCQTLRHELCCLANRLDSPAIQGISADLRATPKSATRASTAGTEPPGGLTPPIATAICCCY
jgi:hypothetical protein